jgi:hypothetical protein
MEINDYVKVAISNCESIDGQLIYKLGYDSIFNCWFLDCGKVTFMLCGGQEQALALLAALKKV